MISREAPEYFGFPFTRNRGPNTIGLIHQEKILIAAEAVGVNIMFGTGAVMSIKEEVSRLVLAKGSMSFFT